MVNILVPCLFVVVLFPRQAEGVNTFSTAFARVTLKASKATMKRTVFFLMLSGLLSPQLLAPEKARAQAPPSVGTRPAYGRKLEIAGIHNAGKINEHLYRGAQPRENGLAELEKLGVTTIVDLRQENREKADWERRAAEALGMRFVHIPVGGWAPPSDEQVAEFLELFRDDPEPKVFVHCRFGDDRTGVFVATYRMAIDQWSAEQALGEMYFFGFNGFWHPSMKKFIRQFPEHLGSRSAFAWLAHARSR